MALPLRLELTVTSLAPGGSGVAHADLDGERRAIFLPRTAPGDVVRAEIDPSRRPAEGRVLDVSRPGPDRVTPACAAASTCGGCDWMHLSEPAQRASHLQLVRDALPAAWRALAAPGADAPAPLASRARARVHVRCGRAGVAEVGMYAARSHHPVTVDVCAVLDPDLERARRALGALFAGCQGRGEVQLALGAQRRPVLEIVWTGRLTPQVYARLEQGTRDGSLAGARITEQDASRPAVIGDPTPWMTGADGQPLRLAPGGFGQATEATSGALVRRVGELVSGWKVDRAVELYAGSGNLSVALSPQVGELVTVETSRDACAAARANLDARGLRARVVEGDAGAYAWSPATRLVVLDPPRTGAREVAARLAASRVARVVYVSCDPQTLGRDLGALVDAYEPLAIETFEMFPQTSHVETVVALARRRGPRA